MKNIQQIFLDEILLFVEETGKSVELNLIAQAKINLNLNILGKRSDNYHELETVMQSIALHDQIKIIANPISQLPQDLGSQILLESYLADDKVNRTAINNNFDDLNEIKSNLIYKAAKSFLDFFQIKANLKIILKKQIPISAGLAGGSTDAAATLKGLLILFNYLHINPVNKNNFFLSSRDSCIKFKELLPMAEKIGADVPFCLHQGTALCKGKGEKIFPLQSFALRPLILYNSALPVFTAEAFKQIDAKFFASKQLDSQSLIDQYNLQLNRGFSIMNQSWQNDFTDFLLMDHPHLQSVIDLFKATDADFVRFTGSGPTLFAFYPSYTARDLAMQILSKQNLPGQLISTYTSNPR
ncbi:MAG: hypothetical protein GX909_03030 [Clostridiaceae bacterium]|nr:hypothetical protein [Clostridiaceae bacterium]